MDEAAQRQFVADNMDSDLQFVMAESGVSLANQVAVPRHYGSMRRFNAIADDGGTLRTVCLQDFAMVQDNPVGRAQIASIVSAWETAREMIAKEMEFRAEAKILGQPRSLQTHERQAMLRAVETAYGTIPESETPSNDYLSSKPRRQKQMSLLHPLWMRSSARSILLTLPFSQLWIPLDIFV